jgi:hypothetical protein
MKPEALPILTGEPMLAAVRGKRERSVHRSVDPTLGGPNARSTDGRAHRRIHSDGGRGSRLRGGQPERHRAAQPVLPGHRGGGTEPGNASLSPGSPFNEPTATSLGGTGGQHYNETSQYDVACYQVSKH